MFAKGLPRNLGDPAVSTSVRRRQMIEAPAQYRRGAGNSNSPLPNDEQQSVVPPGERKESEAGRTAGSRSTLIVPVKLANCRPREPAEGSGVPNHGIVERKHSETSCSSSSVQTQRRRIADQGCQCSKSRDRGAGCGNPARPDLQGGPGRAIASVYPTKSAGVACNFSPATAAPLRLRHAGPGRTA